MKSYCLKCKNDNENINARVSNSSNSKIIILSKLEICGSKKSRSVKNKEPKALLTNLGLRIQFSKVPLLGDFFFFFTCI